MAALWVRNISDTRMTVMHEELRSRLRSLCGAPRALLLEGRLLSSHGPNMCARLACENFVV